MDNLTTYGQNRIIARLEEAQCHFPQLKAQQQGLGSMEECFDVS